MTDKTPVPPKVEKMVLAKEGPTRLAIPTEDFKLLFYSIGYIESAIQDNKGANQHLARLESIIRKYLVV